MPELADANKQSTVYFEGIDHAIALFTADDDTKAVIYAARCGARLLEAKNDVEHGEWLGWLSVNTKVSYDKSKRYMRLAKEMPELLDANSAMSPNLPGTYQALALISADEETKAIVREKCTRVQV